jgi:cardiolipin synthase
MWIDNGIIYKNNIFYIVIAMALRKSKYSQSAFTSNNKVRLVRGGHEYFDLIISMIDKAAESIHLQTYIYDADETGQEVADALIRAAKRKVDVYVIVDGYASQSLPKQFINKLKNAGVHFRYFEPLIKSRNFYFGRRLHSKVIVTDTRYILVGGVNITNRYNDMPGQPAWLDFALYAEGPVAREVCILCWKTWYGYPKRILRTPCDEKPVTPASDSLKNSLVRMRRNDWVRNKLDISNSYLEMFRTANSEITILSSYALPGDIFRKNMEKAVRRGVKVKMIISGESDVMLVKYAERYWYDWLMRNNIEIYEYTKNVLHGKMAICDSDWLTIGSYNVNDLSAYASIELNIDVRDPEFISEVQHLLNEIISKDCILITKEKLVNSRSIFNRFTQWMAYGIIRLVFYASTFYYRHQQ